MYSCYRLAFIHDSLGRFTFWDTKKLAQKFYLISLITLSHVWGEDSIIRTMVETS